jgi:hypothetical protein
VQPNVNMMRSSARVQIWNVTPPGTVWCDECQHQTDHNGEWHRRQVEFDAWPP